MELTSTTAATVRRAARLRKRAHREADGLFLAEGPQAVREAISAGAAISVFATADAATRHAEIADAAARTGVTWHRSSGAVMAHLSDTVTPQGMVAVCRDPAADLEGALAGEPRLVVVLAYVRDPGNAGTVIRVADAAGADAVVVSSGSVDVLNAKCVRASAGSLFHLPVVRGVPVTEAVAALRSRGLQVLAADGAAGSDLTQLAADGGLVSPTGWLLGNEAWGLPTEVAELADRSVAVPIYGRAESLNLSTAAAVCLYASATTQRTSSAGRGAAGPQERWTGHH